MSTDQHRLICAIATTIAITFFVLLRLFVDFGTYATYGYPLMTLYLAWNLWALLRGRIPVNVLTGISFWALALFWIGMMISPLLLGSDAVLDVEQTVPRLYVVFIVLCILAHLVFSTRTALFASGAILAATAASSTIWSVSQLRSGRSLDSLVEFMALEAVLVIAILLLYSLAKSKDDHAKALLEAERMRGLAYDDVVTGLPNRRRVEEDLQRYLALAEREEHPLSVVFCDIDRFKRINDAYGHRLGDEVLEETGKVVGSALRAGDVFGRWGGEEFVMIAPETSHEEALALAERIRRLVQEHTYPSGIRITASFGVATRSAGSTAADLVDQADKRLYQAKAEGRDRVVGEANPADALVRGR